ncbi:MAG: hypothetical protein Q9160_002069 [Pyrenula sp. 1 TL-2023]
MANDLIASTGNPCQSKPDFEQQFSQAIHRSRLGVKACATSDEFKDYNQITAPNPCLALPGHGILSLPLTEREAEHLHRTRADQHAICQIDRKDIAVKNPAFQEWIDQEVLPAACSSLRLNAENGFEKVSAVLDTFVFYDTARKNQDAKSRHGLSTDDRDYLESVAWHLNKILAPSLITAFENRKNVDKPSLHLDSLRPEEQRRMKDLLQQCAVTDFVVCLADLDIMGKERVEGSSSCKRELTLLRVTSLDGKEYAQDVPFIEGDTHQSFWGKRRPDDEEHENGWSTRHWFETIAVVIPKCRQMKFFCSGKRVNPDSIAEMLENDDSEIQSLIFPILTATLREFHAKPKNYQASKSSLQSLFAKSFAIFLVTSVGPEPGYTEESEAQKQWETAKETARKVIQKLANATLEDSTTPASALMSSTGDGNTEGPIELVDREAVQQSSPLEPLLGSECFHRLLEVTPLCENLGDWRRKRKADASEHQSKRTKISTDEDSKADKKDDADKLRL